MLKDKCPLCGTRGKIWNREPDAFRCPNCMSVFSEFGLIIESDRELPELWS